MMNFITMTLAVMLGTLLAYGLIVALVLNKKVMKAYTKWATKLSMEIQEEALKSFEEKEEA